MVIVIFPVDWDHAMDMVGKVIKLTIREITYISIPHSSHVIAYVDLSLHCYILTDLGWGCVYSFYSKLHLIAIAHLSTKRL